MLYCSFNDPSPLSSVRPSAPCPGLCPVNTSSAWIREGWLSSGVTSETANPGRGHVVMATTRLTSDLIWDGSKGRVGFVFYVTVC